MDSNPLEYLLGLNSDGSAKKVSEVFENLTVTNIVCAFIALFIIVPRVFDVSQHLPKY